MAQVSSSGQTKAKKARPDREVGTSRVPRVVLDLILILSFLSLTVLLGCFPLKDTDFWWHLKAGDQIRQFGQVPTVDTYTFGFEGHPWIDLHWGFQVLLSWGFERGGVVGLNLGKCLITGLALLILVLARRPGWPIWGILLAWIPALLLLSGRMYIRPETLSLLYLAIDLAILLRWDRRPWLAWALPFVQLVWVNSHGLFILGPVVITFAMVEPVFRRGSFGPEGRKWWRVVLPAVGFTGLACLINPYGLHGAIYPLQLVGTMSNPIFKKTIAELEPLSSFIEKDGFKNFTLQLHFVVMGLGVLSFLVPLLWRGYVMVQDRNLYPVAEPAVTSKKPRSKRKMNSKEHGLPPTWILSPFRLLLFGAFSGLSLLALRNSNQFAAVAGTVTAWNFGEWLAAIRARRLRLYPMISPDRGRLLAPVLSLGLIALTITAVATGRLYAWAKEGRTIGLGEEPLWFPHEAVKFAGGPEMPRRLVTYHNGLAPLYEYYFAPERQVYTDARLEVMGATVYQEYLDLQSKIKNRAPGWSEALEALGKPAILIDTTEYDADMIAVLLTSLHWRCVWFDPIAAVFVHDSLTGGVNKQEVDFLGRHFSHFDEHTTDDAETLLAKAKALRLVAKNLVAKPGNEVRARGLTLLGLDYARRLRVLDPGGLDGWKQAGLLHSSLEPLEIETPIPRYRMTFDPVIDLPTIQPTFELVKAVEVEPRDGFSLFNLGMLYQMRGMDDAALPILERYVGVPVANPSQKRSKVMTEELASNIRPKIQGNLTIKWANLSELDRVINDLLAAGRPTVAADVMESAYRLEARPWAWADRLAVLRLHLGEPARARAAWLAVTDKATPEAIRAARVAVTYLVEGNLDAARKSYREAIVLDPKLFEAHYGLALLEQDAGNALPAIAEAKLADQSALNENSRLAARSILQTTKPYASPSNGPH